MATGSTRRRKRYVSVDLEIDESGRITPRSITLGRCTYKVDEVTDMRKTWADVGGYGTRYTVSVGGTRTFLFCEGARWFVEEKVRSRKPVQDTYRGMHGM